MFKMVFDKNAFIEAGGLYIHYRLPAGTLRYTMLAKGTEWIMAYF